MNRNCIRIAACALAGTFAFSGYHTSTYAKVNPTRMLPTAGIAVVLEEGTSIQELTEEVIQNIAYLESVSGLKHNIMIAAGQVPLAEGVAEQGILSEETETSASEMPESMETADTLESTETTSAESEEKKETENVSLSAGFSATDTYRTEDKVTEETTEETTEEETESEMTEETTEEETEQETTEEMTEEEQDFSGLVIAKVNHYVNVRSMPDEKSEIVGKLYDKSVGEFIEEADGWYKIVSGNCTGYVKGEYCVTGKEAEELAKEVGTTYAIVNTTTLKVRQDAGTDATVLGLVPMNEELVVVEELDDWVKVAIEEGDGYVSKEYVKLRTDFVHAESKEEEEARLAKEKKEREDALAAARAKEAAKAQEQAAKQQTAEDTQEQQAGIEVQTAEVSVETSATGSEMGNAVIAYATQFVGNPYVYGGTSLTNGADCSGFVMKVYENFGVSLPHSSSALRSKGYDVGGLDNAQPGDIVCYSGHVGLYMGNGKIVHASTSRTGITISNAAYRQVLTVRRIF